eukprot:SAG31_NODE_4721_length_3007_cov_5.646836_3_plen_106_part_00
MLDVLSHAANIVQMRSIACVWVRVTARVSHLCNVHTYAPQGVQNWGGDATLRKLLLRSLPADSLRRRCPRSRSLRTCLRQPTTCNRTKKVAVQPAKCLTGDCILR